jgi:hypothetical protein
MANLALNPTAFAKGFATLFNKDAQKWFESTGYSTSGRGLDAATSIESANKAIEKLKSGYKKSEVAKITGLHINTITKINKALNKLESN